MTDTDLLRCHAICARIRLDECRECPAKIMTPYGSGVMGCVLLAQEILEIARLPVPEWKPRERSA